MKIAAVSGMGNVWSAYKPDVLDRSDRGTVGGGEAAMLQTSFHLARRGHQVTVYYPGEPAHYRGVEFRRSRDAHVEILVADDLDAVVSWSDKRVLQFVRPGVKRIFSQQLNDLPPVPLFWETMDVLVTPTRTHANFLASFAPTGTKPVKLALLGGGLDTMDYSAAPPLRERKHIVSYWSSPDRGLHHLILCWPQIRAAVPDAELHVFYHVNRFIKGMTEDEGGVLWHFGELAWRGVLLKQMLARPVPGLTIHGAVSRHELAKWQMRTRVLAYPLDTIAFTEGFCHPPGTLIQTKEGLKPVESLALTDQVLGHSGNWRPIVGLASRQYEGLLYRIKPACGEAIEFTGDHPIRACTPTAAKTDASNFSWVPADQIRDGMYLYSPRAKAGQVIDQISVPTRHLLPHQELKGVAGSMKWHGHAPVALPETVRATPLLCRLIGYFTGDGMAAFRGRSASNVRVYLGKKNKAAWVEDCALGFREFGLDATVVDHATKAMVEVRVESSALSYALATWCYAPDHQKRLPAWVMDLPDDLVEEVLKGLWRTDGCVFAARREDATNPRIANFTSVSPYLIGQVRILLGRLGYRVAIQTRIHDTGKRSYCVIFSIAGAFLDYERVGRDQRNDTHHFVRSTDDGQLALRVREVTTRPYNGTVYSIKVAEDESYQVGNFIAHNCVALGEGIAAGARTVAHPADAVREVYGEACEWVEAEVCDQRFRDRFTEAVIAALRSDENPKSAEAPALLAKYTWANSAAALERAILAA